MMPTTIMTTITTWSFNLLFRIVIAAVVDVLTHSVVSDSSWLHGLYPARLLCPCDSPGKNTGAGCHFLLEEIFPDQGSKLRLFHPLGWQADS